jgi:hypothetical protein
MRLESCITHFTAQRHSAASFRCYAAGAASPADPWQRSWQELLQRLHREGHFEGDTHVSEYDLGEDKAAVKRAVLHFARLRADILSSLDAARLAELVRAGVPATETDRKTRNAYRRLQASVLRGEDLPPGDGGPADFQDVLRLVLALDGAAKGGGVHEDDAELAGAAAALLPDVLLAMETPPAAGPQLSEKAKNMQRMKEGARPRPAPRARPSAQRSDPWRHSTLSRDGGGDGDRRRW